MKEAQRDAGGQTHAPVVDDRCCMVVVDANCPNISLSALG